jgi:hypothetical protein
MDREQIELINRAEELLSHARAVARRIEMRTSKVMQKFTLPARLSRDGPTPTVVAERNAVRPPGAPTAH